MCVCVCVEDSAVYVIYVNDMYVSVCESALGDCVCLLLLKVCARLCPFLCASVCQFFFFIFCQFLIYV